MVNLPQERINIVLTGEYQHDTSETLPAIQQTYPQERSASN